MGEWVIVATQPATEFEGHPGDETQRPRESEGHPGEETQRPRESEGHPREETQRPREPEGRLGEEAQPLLTYQDACNVDWRERVSCKAANRILKKLRDRTVGSVQDLSDGSVFNWRGYVAYHHQAREIIGPGIARFEFRFVNAWDPNCQQKRGDFVVRRVDNTDVRLHPGCNGETTPVYGHVGLWTEGPAPSNADAATAASFAAMQGQRRDQQGFHNISQADVLGAQGKKTILIVPSSTTATRGMAPGLICLSPDCLPSI